ncbi:MAG: copper amine oxidase N-terminal domain-containing protein, partial [Syntrophomonadaceae bacterium]|nr:copper amine oxidase N-terminal domain-containing protein [Syntrophomonadaceae bacterium]
GSGSETYILLAIGSTTAIVNDNPGLLDVPPVIKDGYTMVPLRFIAEAAGYKVDWNEENRQVLINDWTSDSPDYRPLWAQITANSGYLTSIDAQFDVNVRIKQFNNSPVPALPLNLRGNITMSAKEDENLSLAMDMKSTFANFFPYTDVKIYIKDGYFYINYYSGNQNIKTKISLPDLSNNNLISIMYVDFSTSKNNINALQPLTSTQFDHYVKQLFMESDVPNAKITLTFDGSALSSRLKRYFVPAISLNDIQCILTTDENNHLQTIIFETAGTIKNDPYVNISAELNGSVLIKAYGEDQVEVKFPSDLDTYILMNL